MRPGLGLTIVILMLLPAPFAARGGRPLPAPGFVSSGAAGRRYRSVGRSPRAERDGPWIIDDGALSRAAGGSLPPWWAAQRTRTPIVGVPHRVRPALLPYLASLGLDPGAFDQPLSALRSAVTRALRQQIDRLLPFSDEQRAAHGRGPMSRGERDDWDRVLHSSRELKRWIDAQP